MKRHAVLAVLATVLVVAAAALGWLVGTEAGLHWAAAQASKQLAFDNLRGRLAGEVTADRRSTPPTICASRRTKSACARTSPRCSAGG